MAEIEDNENLDINEIWSSMEIAKLTDTRYLI